MVDNINKHNVYFLSNGRKTARTNSVAKTTINRVFKVISGHIRELFEA